jgi:hypothetical protein
MISIPVGYEVLGRDRVEFVWWRSLGSTGSPVLRALACAFEDIHGVEEVRMKRYSCVVYVAPHLVPRCGIVAALAAALDCPEVRYQLREALGARWADAVRLELTEHNGFEPPACEPNPR